ncbi:glycosyltransferase family 4 protein [Microbacterium schleiferi]|uniref:Glycosyltransferase family 4 protein n=1 Tax=Microbacterium schleiferi TaxID=69362 RepID=A0A7S8MZ46_9MICO|nr:glycosyltransferase family 4 protein [Microbacterium schleiferi]QPE05323.1 glycosyltransferase family 4 protein [Microbacterium schleiferi]
MTGPHVAVVAQSSVDGGAEKYLRMLYGDGGIPGTLFGSIPRWAAPQVDVDLGPKWGSRTLFTGLAKLRSEQERLDTAVGLRDHSLAHVQFKREQIGFTRQLAQDMPVLWTEHGVFNGRMRFALGNAYRRASREATAIICVSEEAAASLTGTVYDRRRIVVIENPVDTSSITPPNPDIKAEARDRLGVNPDGPLAIWVGRLDKGKRPELAMRIGREWRGQLLIAGEGPLRAALRDGEGVRILGFMDPTDLYQAADVLLMTSDGSGEGLPNNVLLEAAAHGVPAVVDGSVAAFRRVVKQSGGLPVHGDWIAGLDLAVSERERRQVAREWAEAHDLTTWRIRHREVFEAAL